MSDELRDDEREAIRAAALTLKCPRCGMPPGASCQSSRGKFLPSLHAERLAAGEGVPSKENREHLGWRGWGQARADPTIVVRRIARVEETDPPASGHVVGTDGG